MSKTSESPALAVDRLELCRRLRHRCLRNLIAASAADLGGGVEQARQYRFAARVLASWAEELCSTHAT